MWVCKRKCSEWLTVIFLVWSYASGFDIPRPHCPPTSTKCDLFDFLSHNNLTTFGVNGILMDIWTPDTNLIVLTCRLPSLPLDDPSFPKFEHTMQFRSIVIKECILPQNSYVQTLDELKISGFDNLTIEFDTCEQKSAFTEQHFDGLVNLKALKISCKNFYLNHLDYSVLKPLGNLTHIDLNNMVIAPFPPENRLNSVKISNGTPLEKLQPWGDCEKLENLIIINWGVIVLPGGWLAMCSHLVSLHLEKFTTLTALPKQMINSSNLISLTIANCHLRNLPNDFLDHAKSLRFLNLSMNSLEFLDRNMFSSIPLLETLVLTQNLLMIDSIPEFAPLVHLKSLNLDNNLDDDTCKLNITKFKYTYKSTIVNPWPNLPSLEQLSLVTTNATVLCAEWALSMPNLKYLYLRRTSIKKLRYDDIQLIRANGWDVDLSENTFEAVIYNESDSKTALEDSRPNNATIRISEHPLDCKCNWYQFARVMQRRSGYIQLPDLLCKIQWGKSADSMRLEQMRPEDFICQIDSEPGCRSYLRIHDNTSQVNCTNAGLDHFPRISRLREIHLANNRIEKIHATDLPETLEYLDLQYNRLSVVDEDTALVMFKRPTTQYYLKGNSFSCLCINRAWIDLLQMHHTQVKDYEEVLCTHGVQIKDVNTNVLCMQENAPLIAGSLACIALLFAVIMIIYYQYKKEIHIILYSRGWCAFCVNEEELDKDMIYDVFVSFAYEDSDFVMNELIPGLEKGPHAYSVCVHYRDWTAGEWIPNQIARSVEESRRTVIVLSKNFLASIWSLLEFRTAHTQVIKDGRVRLIIVLLEDVVNDERVDGELRSYLATNTYLRWGDPKFWDKLLYALPHHGTDGKQKRPAGEAVVRLVRPNDPPIILRDGIALEMAGNGAYYNEGLQVMRMD